MKSRNLFWGVFFILAAIAIILNQLGVLEGISLINLVITILLIPIMIKSTKALNFLGILVPLAIIVIIYSDELGIQKLAPMPILGSAIFLSIGLSFLIHPRYSIFEKDNKHREFEDEESINETNKGEVNLFTKFAGSVKYINSNDLKKVNINCSFGAMKVYLDNSELQENEATVKLNVEFAGVELYIPKEWKVIDNVNCLFGGIEEKNNKGKTEDKKLILTGKVKFAGVEIIYI